MLILVIHLPFMRMESKHACYPSLHLFAVRTTSARRLLASPAACSPLAAITRSGYARIYASNQWRQHLLDIARPPPRLLFYSRRRCSSLPRTAMAPLFIMPPVVEDSL